MKIKQYWQYALGYYRIMAEESKKDQRKTAKSEQVLVHDNQDFIGYHSQILQCFKCEMGSDMKNIARGTTDPGIASIT